MNYYALQVKTRSEDQYIKLVANAISNMESIRLVFPRRRMQIRKDGAVRQELMPVFPGYVFLEANNLSEALYWILRTTPGFFRFLPDNKQRMHLEGRDLSTLKHFMSFGPVAESSRVTFDADDRIHVEIGPLKGLEGRIIKVDKRKGRAKVKLDMYDESFLIDLSFEQIGQT